MTRATESARPARTLGHRLARGLAVAIVVAYVLVAVARTWLVLAGAGEGDGLPLELPSAVTPASVLSRDGCKDGGWEDLGFDNQGLCIAAPSPTTSPDADPATTP